MGGEQVGRPAAGGLRHLGRGLLTRAHHPARHSCSGRAQPARLARAGPAHPRWLRWRSARLQAQSRAQAGIRREVSQAQRCLKCEARAFGRPSAQPTQFNISCSQLAPLSLAGAAWWALQLNCSRHCSPSHHPCYLAVHCSTPHARRRPAPHGPPGPGRTVCAGLLGAAKAHGLVGGYAYHHVLQRRVGRWAGAFGWVVSGAASMGNTLPTSSKPRNLLCDQGAHGAERHAAGRPTLPHRGQGGEGLRRQEARERSGQAQQAGRSATPHPIPSRGGLESAAGRPHRFGLAGRCRHCLG